MQLKKLNLLEGWVPRHFTDRQAILLRTEAQEVLNVDYCSTTKFTL